MLSRYHLFSFVLFAGGLALAQAEIDSSATSRAGADHLVGEALAAEARFDSKAALELFKRADAARPNDPFILQKLSRQFSDLTVDATDKTENRRLCAEALAYAKRAVELQPDNAVNVLSLAVCYGKLGLYSDNRTRIEYSRLVREYAEQAERLNPNFDYAHHVLGRWHYEVASLSGGTRFLVKLIYGGLPRASTSKAIWHLRRAVELSPTLPSHRVELGFALLADAQRDAARIAFEQALALPTQEKYDTEARRRALTALEALR